MSVILHNNEAFTTVIAYNFFQCESVNSMDMSFWIWVLIWKHLYTPILWQYNPYVSCTPICPYKAHVGYGISMCTARLANCRAFGKLVRCVAWLANRADWLYALYMYTQLHFVVQKIWHTHYHIDTPIKHPYIHQYNSHVRYLYSHPNSCLYNTHIANVYAHPYVRPYNTHLVSLYVHPAILLVQKRCVAHIELPHDTHIAEHMGVIWV